MPFMNNIVRHIAVIFVLLTASEHLAQSTTYVSTLTQPSGSFFSIGGGNTWAQAFVTGPNFIYDLTSVDINAEGTGQPQFQLSLYTNMGGSPGAILGPLTGTNPGIQQVYAYTTPGIVLAPSTQYWIVAQGPPTSADFSWAVNFGTGYTATNGWTIPVNSQDFSTTNGATWGAPEPGVNFLFDVNASAIAAVPEPSTLADIVVALAGWISLEVSRRRRRQTVR
jgi:hypothetical protein